MHYINYILKSLIISREEGKKKDILNVYPPSCDKHLHFVN